MNIAKIRILPLMTSTSGVQPTVPATYDHTDGSWLPTDIYPGETYVNISDGITYTRMIDNSIIQLAEPVWYFSLSSTFSSVNQVYISGSTNSGINLEYNNSYYVNSSATLLTSNNSCSIYTGDHMIIGGTNSFTITEGFKNILGPDAYQIFGTYSNTTFNFKCNKTVPDGLTSSVIIKSKLVKINRPT